MAHHVVAGSFVDCLDDARFATLRQRDGVPDPWSPAFARVFPQLRLIAGGSANNVERAQVATGGGGGGCGAGSWQVLLLSPAEHGALASLARKGLAEHLLSGSLLAPVYAHFTLVSGGGGGFGSGGFGSGTSFALLAAGGPRCSCAQAGAGGCAQAARYAEVLEVGGGCRHAKALVLGGRFVLKPGAGSASSSSSGRASSSSSSSSFWSSTAVADSDVKGAYQRGKAHAAAAKLPWRRDAPSQRALAALVGKDAAWLAAARVAEYTLVAGVLAHTTASGAAAAATPRSAITVLPAQDSSVSAVEGGRVELVIDGYLRAPPSLAASARYAAKNQGQGLGPAAYASRFTARALALLTDPSVVEVASAAAAQRAGSSAMRKPLSSLAGTPAGSAPRPRPTSSGGLARRKAPAVVRGLSAAFDLEAYDDGAGGSGGFAGGDLGYGSEEDVVGGGGGGLAGLAEPVWPRVCGGTEGTVSELLDDASALVGDDYPCKAVAALRRARAAAAREDEKGHSGGGGGGGWSVAKVNADPRAAAAAEIEKELVALLEDMMDEEVWAHHGVGRTGASVCTERPVPGEPAVLMRFRAEMEVKADLFEAVSVINECEDFPLWMPGIDQSATKKSISMFRRVVRTSGARPWPFPRDEVMMEAYGDTCDARDLAPARSGRGGGGGPLGAALGRGVAIFVKPAGSAWPTTPGCKAIDLTGGFWFEQVGPRRTRVIFVATIDPHIALPAFIINWVLSNLAYLLLPMLYKHSKQYAPGAALRDRIDAKPDVYGEIQRRLDVLEATAEAEAVASTLMAAPGVANAAPAGANAGFAGANAAAGRAPPAAAANAFVGSEAAWRAERARRHRQRGSRGTRRQRESTLPAALAQGATWGGLGLFAVLAVVWGLAGAASGASAGDHAWSGHWLGFAIGSLAAASAASAPKHILVGGQRGGRRAADAGGEPASRLAAQAAALCAPQPKPRPGVAVTAAAAAARGGSTRGPLVRSLLFSLALAVAGLGLLFHGADFGVDLGRLAPRGARARGAIGMNPPFQ